MGPNSAPATQANSTVKTKRLMLLNGESKTGKSDNYILKSSLEDKQKIFEMFNINMSALKKKSLT